MDYNVEFNIDNNKGIDIINEQISLLENSEDIKIIKESFKEVITKISDILNSKEILDELKLKVVYQKNEYSKERTKENILKAKERVIQYLKEIVYYINCKRSRVLNLNSTLTQETAIVILKRILNNFYKHIETMYEEPVHGKAGITKQMLDNIKIVNEYDVQRILYSLIKPIFPSARVEVSNDTGFSTIRYDILIEEFSVVIEVKCSRKGMTEKKLTEEIGSDIFHYKYNNIFFFIYDKEKIIKNSTSFKSTYNTMSGQKNISTILIQPISL